MIKIFAEKFSTLGKLERQVNEFISEQKSVYPNTKFKTTLISYETKGYVVATIEYDVEVSQTVKPVDDVKNLFVDDLGE